MQDLQQQATRKRLEQVIIAFFLMCTLFILQRQENHGVFSSVDELPLLTLEIQCNGELSPDLHCQWYSKSTHHSKTFVPSKNVFSIHLHAGYIG